MKRFISILLVALMMATLLTFSASAKDPFGTVVEASYTKTAPDMSDKLPDSSWGTAVAHVDKNTKNAAITDYMLGRGETTVKADQTLNFDMYAKWTDDTLYLCFTSPDTFIRGAVEPQRGDGFQIDIVYGICDISHYSAQLGTDPNTYVDAFSYCVSFFVDDYSMDCMGAAWNCDTVLSWDEKTTTLVAKFAIPFTQLGLSKKDVAKDGDYLSFSMIRMDGNKEDPTGYTGWLEWGDFFNKDKGMELADPNFYVPASMNTKTTSANSIKLVGKNGGTTPTTPTTPVTPAKEEPSSWAKAEVDKAIAAGIVPEALQANYTKGISRENLSKLLAKLLDKVYGKAAATSTAKFNDTTDKDVLYAANLGIINGYKQADGTYNFKPANTLKRSEMSVVLNRVAKLCGKTVTGYDSEINFTDTASHWCKSELGWPVHREIIKGYKESDGTYTFKPENTLTTEQTILMIYRAYEALK
ncbi:MAG: S-layer homology domain-containing protein [bacterium]|nr:S-layer homology domain-containing protein [bacterium]